MPGIGLPAVFMMSLLGATLLPGGSEPVLLGYLSVMPHMFWVAIGVATVGNTLGGLISYGMGAGAHGLFGRWRGRRRPRPTDRALTVEMGSTVPQTTPPTLTPARRRAEKWAQRFGAPILLLAWLPVVGDPLCAVAGWLRLSVWQCVVYMAIGKFGRYVMLAWAVDWAMT